MKRVNSLKGRNSFKEVFQKGKRIQDRAFQIIVLKPSNHQTSTASQGLRIYIKIGLSISRKFGKAHDRNHAKRRIRAICSELLHEMKIGYCLVIRPGYDFKDIQYDDLKQSLRSLLYKAGVIA